MTEIRTESSGGILTITIDRPWALNALDPLGHRAMDAAFDRLEADPALRVAIVTGAGARAFCVGSDLKARAATNADDMPPNGFAGLTHRIARSKPVISAVNGLALGGGVEIVLACDLAIAADTAAFALPEPRVGLAAIGGGGLQRLARALPMKHAMDLVLTGRRIGAEEAQTMGLVSRVVPAERLQEAARAMAVAVIAGAPLAIAASQEVIKASLAMPDIAEALRADYPAINRMLASTDAKEGQAAFMEKRAPVWRGC